MKWLSVNNCFYSTLTFPEIDTLPLPQIEIVDESDEVDSENENVELIEDSKSVFPQRDMSEQNCGLESIKSFMEVVDKVCESGINMGIISRSLDEIVPDYKDDNILKALPKVYPYGFGGKNDTRYDSKGCISYQ